MPPTPPARVGPGELLALLAAVAFSFKAIFVRMALAQGADPILLLTMRMTLAAPLNLAILLWAGRPAGPVSGKDVARIVVLGVVGFAVSAALDFWGLSFIGAGLERIVLYLHPTLVLLMTAALQRRAPSRRSLVATGVAWLGLVIACIADVHSAAPSALVTGVSLVLGCAFTYAVYLVSVGALAPRLGAMRVSISAQLVAGIVLAAWTLTLHPAAFIGLPAGVWEQAALLATIGTVLPGLLLAAAIHRIGAGRASTMGMIGPVIASLLGWALLGEPLSVLQMVGGVVVAVGVGMATRA